MASEMLLNEIGSPEHIAVERALSEFRAARPVAIHSQGGVLLAFPIEGLSEPLMPLLQKGRRSPRIIVPSSKIKPNTSWEADFASVDIAPFTPETVTTFIDHVPVLNGTVAAAYSMEVAKPGEAELAALALANLALLLPAAVTVELDQAALQSLPVLSVDATAILNFRDHEAETLKIVARTHVPLDGVDKSEFVIFRGGDGFRDQIAIIVGEPSARRPVMVRIHSACLTGDLFGSLKCDCGDQLRGTVRTMSEQGGGIVLYLDQEGRGNGIANKIRAYGLQAQGYDTYAADELLGFGLDQRRFDFAGEMLKQLGFTSIKLMTNNPEKIEALRKSGLDVVSTHRVFARHTAHNVKYLVAKRDKAGHLLGDAALDGQNEDDVLASMQPAS